MSNNNNNLDVVLEVLGEKINSLKVEVFVKDAEIARLKKELAEKEQRNEALKYIPVIKGGETHA